MPPKMGSLKLKTAWVPVMTPVAMTPPPFLTRLTEASCPAGLPAHDRVRLVIFTLPELGFSIWIWATVTPAAPWIWVELAGAPEPWEIRTETGVGL